MMYRYYPFGMMGGWGWLGVLFWCLLVVALVVVLIAAIRGSRSRTMHHPAPPVAGPNGPDEALEIARRRFAAGEITKEQFDEIAGALKR